MTITKQTVFRTRQIVDVLAALDMDAPNTRLPKEALERQRAKMHKRLAAWHMRGILEGRGQCAGAGSEREYTFDDALFLAVLVYVTRRVADLENASQIATELHGEISAGRRTLKLILSIGDWSRLVDVDAEASVNRLAQNFTRHAPVVVSPGALFAHITGLMQSAMED